MKNYINKERKPIKKRTKFFKLQHALFRVELTKIKARNKVTFGNFLGKLFNEIIPTQTCRKCYLVAAPALIWGSQP